MNYGKNAMKRREHKLDAKSTKVGKKIGLIVWKICLLVIMVTGIVGCSVVFGIVKGAIESAPDISKMDVIPTGYSTTVLASDGTEIATLVAEGANRQYVTIDEIPKHLQHAFVAIEDERFYEHNGIDLKSIGRAFVAGVKNGFHFSQGGSTITQQLIKNNVLTEQWKKELSEESGMVEKFQRKFQEQYLAMQLEKKVKDKDWILENYMNSINLGSNTLGVQSAARRYFGKDVGELTISESAVIAGTTKNPYGYNPINFPQKNAERRERVLKAMKDQGYISEAEYAEALADNVYERISEHNDIVTTSVNTYFVDAVIDDVFRDLVEVRGYSESDAYKAIYQGGLTIRSTQDLSIQQICDEEALNADNYAVNTKYSFFLYFQVKKADGTTKNYTNQTMLSYYKKVNRNENYSINYASEEDCLKAIEEYEQAMVEEGDTFVEGSEYIFITMQPQIAMTIMDQSTGEGKAIVGGRGDKAGNRTWNRATHTTRQPGSTFKIIACYAPALDAGGKTLASVVDDAPFTVGTKKYNNYDGVYRGYTTVREAIMRSMNIVTVKNLQEIGVNLGYEYATEFGFTTLVESDKNLGLSLGGLTKGVTNLELTAAYAAIANKGEYIAPSFYTEVLDHDGRVILKNEETKERHKVIEESTAWLLTDAMKDVMTAGTGTRAYFGNGMAQAGKSGTTTSNRDALFAGFTPYYTCVVWGGYDDNSKQAGGNGTTYPKNLWRSVMKRIHENLEYKDFDVPFGITKEEICIKSGLLAEPEICENDPRSSMVRSEYFALGTVPTESCDHHVQVSVCAASGELAGDFCPEEEIEQRVYITPVEPGSGDEAYSTTEEFLNTFCSVHDESDTEDEDPWENWEDDEQENPVDDPWDDPGNEVDPNDPGNVIEPNEPNSPADEPQNPDDPNLDPPLETNPYSTGNRSEEGNNRRKVFG